MYIVVAAFVISLVIAVAASLVFRAFRLFAGTGETWPGPAERKPLPRPAPATATAGVPNN